MGVKTIPLLINIQHKPASKNVRENWKLLITSFFQILVKGLKNPMKNIESQLYLVTKTPERLKNLFEEIEGKIDSDAD